MKWITTFFIFYRMKYKDIKISEMVGISELIKIIYIILSILSQQVVDINFIKKKQSRNSLIKDLAKKKR